MILCASKKTGVSNRPMWKIKKTTVKNGLTLQLRVPKGNSQNPNRSKTANGAKPPLDAKTIVKRTAVNPESVLRGLLQGLNR